MSADTLTPDGAPVTLPGINSQPGTGIPEGSYREQAYAALPGQDEIVVVSLGAVYGTLAPFGAYGGAAILSGYRLDGSPLFQTTLVNDYPSHSTAIASPTVFAVGSNGDFGAAYDSAIVTPGYANGVDVYAVYDANGSQLARNVLDPGYQTLPAVGTGTPTGFHMEWVTEGAQPGAQPPPYQEASGDFTPDGSHYQIARPDGARAEPYAATGSATYTLAVRDNEILGDGSTFGGVTLPGEPADAVTSVGAALLSGPGAPGGTSAIAWTDSGTAYVSLYYAPAALFGGRIGLDWGGASDIHVVALPSDGGFVVSWMNGGEYKGEVFDGAGVGGGVISLAGDVAGIDSHGDLYTVGLNASGQYTVQTYAINGGSPGGGGGGSTVHTSDASYTAPDGVTTIYLTGSNQTIHANNGGDTIWSDDTANALIGGTGNDTFHLGRGGDWAAGGGGSDTFAFAGIPWAAGGITDFGGGDVLDLSGLLSTTQDIPGGGFSDGYLQLTDDGAGDAQVWARYATSGSDSNWWLVTTLDGISTSSLDAHHTLVTLAPNAHDVSTSASDYVAPSWVTSVTLTGSQQWIDASATSGVTINSNDTGNVLIGGSGDDVFHIGRGGDWIAGGTGADTFAYGGTPWAGGGITDFNGAEGDRIDVSGLLHASGYSGADPFTDGYLKYTTDGSGNAQIWSDLNQPGNDGWWLVATLDGVSTSSLHYSGGLIT